MKRQTVKETFNSPLIRPGIFQYLPTYFDKTALQQSMAYYVQHKHRLISDAFEDYLDDDGKVTEAGERELADVLVTMFKFDWDKQYAVIKADYDPLKNVFGERVIETILEGGHKSEHTYDDVTEREQYDGFKEVIERDYGDGLVNTKHYDDINEKNKYDSYDEVTGGHSSTRTPDGWESTDTSGIAGNGETGFADDTRTVHTESGTVSDVIEYNSEKTAHKSVGDGDVHTVETRDDSETVTGTVSDTKEVQGAKESIKSGTESDEFIYQNEKHTETHSIDMNSGIYITVQKLIEDELELRKKHFYNMMFNDINDLLTLKIYN